MMEDRNIQIERLRFFSNAMLIKSLCSVGAFERMMEIRDHVLLDTDVRMDYLAFGYKLVVQFGLWGLLDHLIRYPELLYLEGEPHLLRWWRIIQGEDGTTLKAAIRDPGTDLARVASGVDDLVTSFRRAGVSWDRIAEANKEADLLSDELLEIARDCPVSVLTDDQPTQGFDRILQTITVSLLDDSWNEHVNSSAFRYCLRKPTEWKHTELPGQSMFDIQTHRDQMSMFPKYDPSEFEPGWMIGKLSALTVSLQETNQWSEDLGDPHKLIRQNSDPNRAWEAGFRIFRHTPGSDLTGFEFGMKRPQRFPAKVAPSLSSEVSLADPVDRLVALLGRRPKLIGSRDARSELHIETIVSGLACTLPNDEPIDILRILHGSPNEITPVSLAVLMPSFTALSDSSEWWVFDRAYRTQGLDANYDQRVSRINSIAERLGKHINWIDLPDVPEDRLLSLCDYQSFRRLRNQFEELERISSKLRGVIPELLSAQLLSQTGYHPVRPALPQVTFPNGVEREIDAVGIRLTAAGGDCKIIEVKGQSASQHDLKRYIHRFSETVRLSNNSPSTIAKLVGSPVSIQNVSGLFISMAKNVDMSDLAMQFGIDFWNFGRFVSELRKAEISERYIDLLQESLFVWENDFRDI